MIVWSDQAPFPVVVAVAEFIVTDTFEVPGVPATSAGQATESLRTYTTPLSDVDGVEIGGGAAGGVAAGGSVPPPPPQPIQRRSNPAVAASVQLRGRRMEGASKGVAPPLCCRVVRTALFRGSQPLKSRIPLQHLRARTVLACCSASRGRLLHLCHRPAPCFSCGPVRRGNVRRNQPVQIRRCLAGVFEREVE